MVSLFIITTASMTLGIMAFVGLFNKRMNGRVNLIIRFIKALEISWKNICRLESRIYLLIKILPHKRGLLIKKIIARLTHQAQVRKSKKKKEK